MSWVPRARQARWATLLGIAVLSAVQVDAAAPVAPPFLSRSTAAPDVSSTAGSGSFGTWTVDRFGLPAYRYTLDEMSAPQAAQSELAGSRDAWSQVGNGHLLATAYNHGYTQVWSQDRQYQWMNRYDATNRHYSGGYGYLNVGGTVSSTLYDDRPAGAVAQRDFGMGYFHKSMAQPGTTTDDVVFAPYGDDSLLLHDVTVTNTGQQPSSGSYFEYWDVNPQVQAPSTVPRGVAAPVYDAASKTLSVAQLANGLDNSPLTIFASALAAPVSGYDTSTSAFFGSGTRAAPAAVASGTTGSIALPGLNGAVGNTMFAMQSPFSLAPGRSVTLRYAYGYGHPQAIQPMLQPYRGSPDAWAASQARWGAWLPKASFGADYGWLSRELQWDAYTVKSGATYDEGCGHHIISQGGYYQYYFGENEAYRDPLQHMLPMIYADPELAREVIRFSAQEQPPLGGQIPYGLTGPCKRFDLGTSDDLGLWLLWSTAEYVLATRDTAFLDEQVPYSTGAAATIADHLKAAYTYQEQVVGHGLHGEYQMLPTGSTGDWNDFATEFLQMSESNLVTAQAAYVYPRLATVADMRGDHAFAHRLRATAATDLGVVRSELGPMGWFTRGYSGTQQIGYGTIFEEPQGWALLAGATTPNQSARLVNQFRRFLSGVGAPAALHGPAKIGSALTAAAADPGITEHPTVTTGTVSNNVGWPPGGWFAVNGWMVWAIGELDGLVPDARLHAWDEFTRNTLHAHAVAYPDHWDGLISVDDSCSSFYAPKPQTCGIGLTSAYNTQIMHQPAYTLFDTIHLAGVTPTGAGMQVVPHLPMDTFEVRFPLVGVAQQPGLLRGYLRPVAAGTLTMDVALPPGVTADRAVSWANGAIVSHVMRGSLIEFQLPASAGMAGDWAISDAGSTIPGTSGALPNTGNLGWTRWWLPAAAVSLAWIAWRRRRRTLAR
ncbi:MAG: GH36-type glycosyl hydrolase domain-containing protein [Candidatus Dormibacteria bacterium]